jgi:hypothetical protein
VTNTRFSDDLIAQYLLGELSENQQVDLEDRAFQDPVLLSNITAVEHDLIDEYVAGQVRGGRLERFESHFLASAERRNKVAFAKALKHVAAEVPSRETARELVPGRSIFANFFAFLTRPATAYAFAVSAVALLIAAAWLVMNTRTLRSEVARLRATQETQQSERRQLEAEFHKEIARGEELAAQLEQAKQDTKENGGAGTEGPQKSRSPIIAALTLLPGLSRSEGTMPRLTIPKDATTVRLQIVIDPNETYRVFSAAVSGGGQTVHTSSRLIPTTSRAGKSVHLNIPASAMKPGRYEVSLKGLSDNGPADIGYYYFDVK